MLSINNLRVTVGDAPILHGLSLETLAAEVHGTWGRTVRTSRRRGAERWALGTSPSVTGGWDEAFHLRTLRSAACSADRVGA